MQQSDQMLRVFIIGTTAVGKTKLSVALAKHLNGEVISCDSKQLYRHASIMTAKVTREEAEDVPHYMVDCLELHENAFNRNKYFQEASVALKGIEGRNKVPVIVGGTNYYIETLLYNLKSLTEAKESSEEDHPEDKEEVPALAIDHKPSQQQQQQLQALRLLSKTDKYSLLLKQDKAIALKTHQNDEKRITQFLERIILKGQLISENYESKTSELRSGQTVVFWIKNSDKEELFGMLSKRVHKMLDREGLSQIFAIYYYIQLHLQQGKGKGKEDENGGQYSGACSSIGISEFKDLYLEVKDQISLIFKGHESKLLSFKEINYPFIHALILSNFQTLTFSQATLTSCRDQLILDTKHYCKRQLTWIRNRMFVDPAKNKSHFFVLELSQQQNQQKTGVMDRFHSQVESKAIAILESVKEKGFGSVVEDEAEFIANRQQESLDEWKKYYCQACDVELNGLYNWTGHVTSKRHTASQKYHDKKDQHQEYIQEQRFLAQQRKQTKEAAALEKDLQQK